MFFVANLATLLTSSLLGLPSQPSRISPLPSVGHSLGLGHGLDPRVESKGARTKDAGSFLDAAEHKGQRARPEGSTSS